MLSTKARSHVDVDELIKILNNSSLSSNEIVENISDYLKKLKDHAELDNIIIEFKKHLQQNNHNAFSHFHCHTFFPGAYWMTETDEYKKLKAVLDSYAPPAHISTAEALIPLANAIRWLVIYAIHHPIQTLTFMLLMQYAVKKFSESETLGPQMVSAPPSTAIIPITIHRNLINAANNNEQWLTRFDQQLSDTRSALSSLDNFNSQRLSEISNRFEIELASLPPGTGGSAVPAADSILAKHKILIQQDSDLIIEEMQSTLANELHHISNAVANEKKLGYEGYSKIEKLFPFFANDGKLSKNLYQQHADALQTGLERIKRFEYLHATVKAKKSLADKDSNFYRECMNELKKYQPPQKLDHMSTKAFFHYFATHTTPTATVKEGKQNPPLKLAIRHKLLNITELLYITFFTVRGNEVAYHYQLVASEASPTEKADIFLRNVFEWKQMIDTSYREYYTNQEKLTFSNRKRALDMELSSYIEQLPQNLKQTFFPEWCSYFGAYTNTPHYCGP